MQELKQETYTLHSGLYKWEITNRNCMFFFLVQVDSMKFSWYLYKLFPYNRILQWKVSLEFVVCLVYVEARKLNYF